MRPHRYRVYIKATPAVVWQGITDPDFTRRYFHGTAFTSTLEPGTGHRYVRDGEDMVVGEVEECDPPHRLVVTWRALYDPATAAEPPSRVEWTLTEAGPDLTRLDVVHGDLGRSPRTWASVKDGWVWILDGLKTLLETGTPLPDEAAPPALVEDVAGDWHRAQAVEANNSAYTLLEQGGATDDVLRSAYAAAYHWQRAAGRQPVNEVRALHLLAKAHLAAGQPAVALEYADRVLGGCRALGLADFDLAYGHEARARALAALGHREEAQAAWAAAHAVPVADDEDREILRADLAVPLVFG